MHNNQAKPVLKLISNTPIKEFVAPRTMVRVRRRWRNWFPRQIPIAYKLSLIISALITLGMIVLGSVVITNQKQLLQQQIDAHGHSVAGQLAESAKEPILADDALSLSVLTSNLNHDDKIKGTAVIDIQGNILARSGMLPLEAGIGNIRARPLNDTQTYSFDWQYQDAANSAHKLVSYLQPVHFQEVRTGYVLITLSGDSLDLALQDSVRAVTAATILMIILAVIVSFVMSRRLSRPIHNLMDASKAIDQGKLNFRIKERRNDEIGELIDSFNNMADGLLHKDQVERAFSRFVSSNVAKQILENVDNVELGGKHVMGSVLFADIVGYTDISEKLTPQATAEMLNEYFSYISEAAKIYHGTIDKFMGDCAMIVFGITEEDDDHCFNALACAVLIQRIINRISSKRIARGEFPVQFRLGVNSGEMLAGNMGSTDRMEFTVVGDSVNLASRLCTFANPGQIIIHGQVYEQEDIKNRIIARQHDPIRLRHKPEPVPTYLVTDVAEPYQLTMERHLLELFGHKAIT
jgi:adenylate cyclase